jgi:hypothetical protein
METQTTERLRYCVRVIDTRSVPPRPVSGDTTDVRAGESPRGPSSEATASSPMRALRPWDPTLSLIVLGGRLGVTPALSAEGQSCELRPGEVPGSAQKRQSGVWPGGGARVAGRSAVEELFDESTRLGGAARSGGGFSTGASGSSARRMRARFCVGRSARNGDMALGDERPVDKPNDARRRGGAQCVALRSRSPSASSSGSGIVCSMSGKSSCSSSST